MSATPRILGLIPARGGSKGLVGKNLRSLAGRPLVAWTIEAALGAASIDAVVVTTDSDEIAATARAFGAEVPFMRPPELAADGTPMLDTVLHALGVLESQGRAHETVMLLQPTSPLRSSKHIDAAVQLMRETGSDAVVSVTEMEHSPLWANTLPEDRRMGSFIRPELSGVRRQDLPLYYRLNGAIYLIRVATLRAERAFVGDYAIAYVMPSDASVDVDTELDLEFAEFLVSRRGSPGVEGR